MKSYPKFKYIQTFGKFGSQNYNQAIIESNGKIFHIRFSGKFNGYRGWYTAELDGKSVSKPFGKMDSLVRDLQRIYP